jgi:formiminotetrahydrofolate cyclodeaminase
MEALECAVGGLRVARRAVGKTNASAASDLGCAAASFEACARSAWLNVLINANGIQDEAFAAACREQGQALLDEALSLAAQAYGDVLALLR